MDTFTFLFSQTNVDKLHLRYTEEIMQGALKAKDLTFVDSKSTFKTLHKLHPQLKVCQTEPLLAANLYVLSSPNNLSALENLLSIWKRPELSAVSLEAEIILYLHLNKRGINKEYHQAAQRVRQEVLKNHTPITPQTLISLRENPEIAVLKLPYLIAQEDYSKFLNLAPTTLTKTGQQCYKKICRYLLQNGFAPNLPEVIEYLDSQPKKELGQAEEIGLLLSIQRSISNNKQISSNEYYALSKILMEKLSARTSLEVLLQICQGNLVTHTETFRPNMSGHTTTITSPYLSGALRDISTLAQKLKSAEINVYIAQNLAEVAPTRDNYTLQELAKTLLTPMPAKFDDALEILHFVKQQFRESNRLFHECLEEIAETFSGNDAYVELTEFKHWAINMANLRSPHAYDESEDTVFVSFYADSPYSLDWKHSLPMLLNCKTLSPKVRKEVIILIASHHAEELPDFLSSEDMKKLAEFKDDLVKNWRKLFE